MSTSVARRKRLQAARDLKPRRCVYCDVALERTVHPQLHVKRCADRLKTVKA